MCLIVCARARRAAVDCILSRATSTTIPRKPSAKLVALRSDRSSITQLATNTSSSTLFAPPGGSIYSTKDPALDPALMPLSSRSSCRSTKESLMLLPAVLGRELCLTDSRVSMGMGRMNTVCPPRLRSTVSAIALSSSGPGCIDGSDTADDDRDIERGGVFPPAPRLPLGVARGVLSDTLSAPGRAFESIEFPRMIGRWEGSIDVRIASRSPEKAVRGVFMVDSTPSATPSTTSVPTVSPPTSRSSKVSSSISSITATGCARISFTVTTSRPGSLAPERSFLEVTVNTSSSSWSTTTDLSWGIMAKCRWPFSGPVSSAATCRRPPLSRSIHCSIAFLPLIRTSCVLIMALWVPNGVWLLLKQPNSPPPPFPGSGSSPACTAMCTTPSATVDTSESVTSKQIAC
mmetsp:Transcript_57032/g.180535  ORF Transcript_57032/g.180535 Transcript_57032/m.180535 type:complete len:403 (+) Transcript_57032:126-1334(+)